MGPRAVSALARARAAAARPAARAALGLAASSVFIALFLRNADFDGIGRAFAEARPEWIAPALAAYFAGVAARAWRWHYLLLHLKRIAWPRLFPIVAIGFGVNNVLPLRTGELVRAHVLAQRHGLRGATGLSTIFMTRVYDGLMLTIFLVAGVAAGAAGAWGMPFPGWWLTGAMAFLVFGMIGAFIVFGAAARNSAAVADFARRWIRRLPGLASSGLDWLEPLVDGVGAQARPAQVRGALWTSFAAWGLEAAMYWMVGEAFSLDLPFAVYLLVAAAANLLITAPSTSGGVGPFEWAAKAVLLIYLPAYGFTEAGAEAAATAYAVSLHALVLIPIAVVGLAFLWLFQVPLRPGAERPQEPSPPS